ncbi:MAG: hypothetical protein K9G44_09915 [Melioribacteraceae bacterium]|nr:hypothetical protein [Melioribacteraceae bacterium]
MKETILNIFLVIEDDSVKEFRAKSYLIEGDDESKISYLKQMAKIDFANAEIFDSPLNKKGEFMKYKHFSKLETQGMHFRLFEDIFGYFNVPQNPLICVTPFYDGKLLTE